MPEETGGLSRRDEVFYKLAIAALAVAFAGLIIVFWYAANPQQHLTVKEPMKIVNKKLNAGDGLRVIYEYCKSHEAQAVVGGFLASRGVIVPIQHLWASALPAGCHSLILDLQVPAITPPGNYKLYLTREYRPTLLTQSSYLFASEPFDVQPHDGSAHIAAPLPPMPAPETKLPQTEAEGLHWRDRLWNWLTRKPAPKK